MVVTRKPVISLIKADHVVRNRIDFGELTEPLRIFEGSAREGVIAFPPMSMSPPLSALPVTLEGAGSRIGATTHANVELSAAAAYFMDIVHEVASEIRAELGQAQPVSTFSLNPHKP